MANIAYIRVSTTDQNTARQEEALKGFNIDKYYIEKVSGKNIKDRPELIKMMDYVRGRLEIASFIYKIKQYQAVLRQL